MAKKKIGTKEKKRFVLLKRLIGLMANKAPLRQYYLEIGAYYLKKGCAYEVGQIIKAKKLHHSNVHRVTVVKGLWFNLHTNEITHTAGKTII